MRSSATARLVAGCSLVAVSIALATTAGATSLKPSSGSMSRQIRAARQHDFTYLKTRSAVYSFVARGYLVPVRGNRDYTLERVSFPYARAEVKLLLERLGKQYRGACGERLVVTSLTRPRSHQPPNASKKSVHPTGMAFDLRRSRGRKCRRWLEKTLLSLEGSGVLEATRERWPPHYHVALFPKSYRRYLTKLGASSALAQLDSQRAARAKTRNAQAGTSRTGTAQAGTSQAGTAQTTAVHRIRRGDTLWNIARRYRTTVEELKRSNRLRSDRIKVGQKLRVPVR